MPGGYKRSSRERKARSSNPMKKKAAKRKAHRPTPTKGVASVPRGFQILNKQPRRIYKFKDTMQLNDINGAGVAIQGLNVFTIKDIARYSNLITMFKQYRIREVKCRFRLENVELTDGAKLPTMYIRYNNDPDLQTAALSEDYFLRQQNVVVKQFHHNTIQGSLLNYNIKPCTLVATMLYPGVVGTATYSPSPQWNKWIDFDPSTTVNETVYYGLQYFITNLPSGITINLDLEYHYECRDLV